MQFYRWLVRNLCEILSDHSWRVRKMLEILCDYHGPVRKLYEILGDYRWLVRKLENHYVITATWPLVPPSLATRGPPWSLMAPRGFVVLER